MPVCANSFFFLCSSVLLASTDTIGPNGIDSAGLTLANGAPMDGGTFSTVNRVAIGEVGAGRAGKPVVNGGFDDTAHSSPDVIPVDVFRTTTSGNSIANLFTSDHGEEVGSVIIGTDMVDPDGAGPRTAPTGVALGAGLYSSSFDAAAANLDDATAVTINHLATLSGIHMPAINLSFGLPLVSPHILDGNQLLTQYIDWSATQPGQDILYVVAGNEDTGGIPIPTDNFNGLTVAFSTREGGVWRRVDSRNNFNEDAAGDRTSVGLLAPGDNVDMTGLNAVVQNSGTSFAAPHVSATVALLQQYANE